LEIEVPALAEFPAAFYGQHETMQRQGLAVQKGLVKGLAKELDIDESFLNRLADEVRKNLG
jgi:hypothetical protein